MKLSRQILILLTGLFCWSREMAAAADDESLAGFKSAVTAHYAEMMSAEYQDSLMLTRQLQAAIEKFLKKPSAEGLAAVRQAWIDCRKPYMQSEVGRFYDGPIEGVEGFINSWPIDENYLDYTMTAPDAGIINQLDAFPQITRDVIVDANAK